MRYHDTEELRVYLDGLLAQIESGTLSNGSARVRLMVAKTMLDSIKVEVAAAALGRTFDKVSFGKVSFGNNKKRPMKTVQAAA